MPSPETFVYLAFIYITLGVVVYTGVVPVFPGAYAACTGGRSDSCEAGLYEVPCPHAQNRPHRTAMCCIRCDENPAPAPVPIPPQADPSPPAPLLSQPIAAPLPTALECPTSDEIIALYSNQQPIIRRRSTPDAPAHILLSCQEYDALLSDLEHVSMWNNAEGDLIDKPAIPWLSTAAFELTAGGALSAIYQTLQLDQIEFSEVKSTCRSTRVVEVTFQFVLVKNTTEVCMPEQLVVSLSESYEYPTRTPLLSELESPELIAIANGEDKDIQCAGQIHSVTKDGDAANRSPTTGLVTKRLAMGPDCRGGTLYTDYILDQRWQRDPEAPEACENWGLLTRSWNTFRLSNLTNVVCASDTLSSSYKIHDTEGPKFLDEMLVGFALREDFADSVDHPRTYWLPTEAEFQNFTLLALDNCDIFLQNKSEAADRVVRSERTPTAENDLATHATVILTTQDQCANEGTLTRNIRKRAGNPPDISKVPLLPTISVSCRSHVPSPPTLYATTLDGQVVTFELKKQTFTFRVNHDEPEELPEEEREGEAADPKEQDRSSICENRLNITQLYELGSMEVPSDSFPVRLEQTFIVDNQEGPVWTSPVMPPAHTVLQCMNELPNFDLEAADGTDGGRVLTAEDICDQIELAIVGTETNLGPEQDPDPSPSALFTSRSPECLDNTRVIRQWIAKNTCGSVSKHVAVYDILDRTPPKPIQNADRHLHLCLDRGTQVMRDYSCFADILGYIRTIVPVDNCGRPMRYRFEGSQSYECKDDNNLASCTMMLPQATNKDGLHGAQPIPFVHKYQVNDTLCIVKRAGILHKLHFSVTDACGRSTPITLDIYAPQRAFDDAQFNPNLPSHVCDNRLIVNAPRDTYWKMGESILGPTYQATKVDQRL